MDLKLGGCSHHSERILLVVPLGSSEVILGSSFVWVYLWYMDVKRNSLCDILKVGESRQPGDRGFENRLFLCNILVFNLVRTSFA